MSRHKLLKSIGKGIVYREGILFMLYLGMQKTPPRRALSRKGAYTHHEENEDQAARREKDAASDAAGCDDIGVYSREY